MSRTKKFKGVFKVLIAIFLVVTKIENEDNITVGRVHCIVVKKGEVHFLCNLYECSRDYLQFFRSSGSLDINDPVLIKNLEDHQPLFPIGSSTNFLFVLKHNLSFEL